MRIIRVIKYILGFAERRDRYPFILPEKHKERKLNAAVRKLAGWLYRRFRRLQERHRVQRYNLRQDDESVRIIGEILRYSRKFLAYFVLTVFVAILLDILASSTINAIGPIRFLASRFDLPSEEFIRLTLGIFIGAISTILGVIFALYAVGFQIATERYSGRVTEYINRDPVIRYFFGLLIFTDLFSLVTLLKLELVEGLPFVSLAISILLVVLSLLSIVIFKDHYLLSLRPVQLLRRTWRDIKKHYEDVSPRQRVFSKSYSIVRSSQLNVSRLIGVAEALFNDLVRDGNYEDAYHGPIFLAHILRDYMDIKRYIDRDRAWWFPGQYEQVKADDMTAYPVKYNYEMMGIGPLTLTRPAFDWLEDRVLGILRGMQNNITEQTDSKIIYGIIDAYKIILAGDYRQETIGHVKALRGAFENQEFSTFDKALRSFLDLYERLPAEDSVFAQYLNALSAVKTVIVDGFNFRKHPGVIIGWEKTLVPWIQGLVTGNRELGTKREAIENSDLGTFFRETLLDYWDRLQVEVAAEGEIVTPKGWVQEEIREIVVLKEQEIIETGILKLVRHTEMIIEREFKGNKEHMAQCVLLNYLALLQLLRAGRWDQAKRVAEVAKGDPGYILYAQKDTVRDLELREQIEKGLFISLANRRKRLYDFYLKSQLALLVVLRHDEQEQDAIIRLMRIPLMIGGLAYLISELDQDFHYVALFAKRLDALHREGQSIPVMEAAEEIRKYLDFGKGFQLNVEESNRYGHFYRQIIDEIHELPEDWISRGTGILEVGSTKTVEHPSAFIRELASWRLSDMDECVRGFIEWMKKREEIKKLVIILNHVASEKH